MNAGAVVRRDGEVRHSGREGWRTRTLWEGGMDKTKTVVHLGMDAEVRHCGKEG